MTTKTLVATLGDHPTVIAGMVKALQNAGIEIDQLYVLYPLNENRSIGDSGFDMVRENITMVGTIVGEPLPFEDPVSEADSLAFLNVLSRVLDAHSDPKCHDVYLSVAGGRKSMSALLALMAQFYPSVKGIYHLLDRREGTNAPTFRTINQLLLSPNTQIQSLFNPTEAELENLNLVKIPYPGAFANAEQLRQILQQYRENDDVSSTTLSPEAEHFYRRVFNPIRDNPKLELWLSKRADDQYQRWLNHNPDLARKFFDCFVQMQDLVRLQERLKGLKGEYHFFKRRRTVERPVFYTKPNAIHLSPKEAVDQVVVVDLCIEQDNGPYQPTGDEVLAKMDPMPYKRLSALHGHQRALIVSLGKSPMIVTQLYTLLSQSEGLDQSEGLGQSEGKKASSVATIALIYPGKDSEIGNTVTLLKPLLQKKKVKVYICPINEISDIDSALACEHYSKMLTQVVEKIKARHPEQVPTLSLAGGRKGMSVLTLFAAQRMGIEHLYHTVIRDPELEEKILKESSYEALRSVSDMEKERCLFLDAYGIDKFSLMRIPVMPLSVDDKTLGRETLGRETLDSKAPDSKAPERKTPGHKTPGHKTPGHKTPGHKTPGHKTPGHKTPGR